MKKSKSTMSGRIGELLVVLFLVLILFGAGKLPQVMEELGRGLKAFRDGMNSNKKDDEESSKDKIEKEDN